MAAMKLHGRTVWASILLLLLFGRELVFDFEIVGEIIYDKLDELPEAATLNEGRENGNAGRRIS